MANTARQWFYSTPEARPYYIEERVNHSLWNNRLQNVFMSCVQAQAPIKMEGSLEGAPIYFEFAAGNTSRCAWAKSARMSSPPSARCCSV